jgi:hypothetical protein
MPRKSIGERPMTAAERQARYRAARATRAGSAHTSRLTIAAGRDNGTTTSPVSSTHRLSMQHGS